MPSMAFQAVTAVELADRLRAVVGASGVLDDTASRTLYSQDIWLRSQSCALVVRPTGADQLARCVATITAAGYSVVPRGGGMSYTQGYVPGEACSVIIDSSGMSRILEINATDMYVTVEAGCSWKALHAALSEQGLRTPYWGTLSGSRATVGGSISQNSIFWGSGQHGSAADSLLSMDVVLADGSILRTGSAAQLNGTPFFRHFGPDLTGLFSCDNGALGVKASITLRLLPVLPSRCCASFDFADYPSMLNAMADIARRNISMECWAADPTLSAQRAQRDRLLSDVRSLAGVVKASSSPWRALRDAFGVAIAGRRFMRDVLWPLHVQIEERSDAAAQAALEEARAIARRHGGRGIENSIPTVVRANPFPPVNNMVGPGGERWAPVHALVPLSKAAPLVAAVERIYAGRRNEIAHFGVLTGYLFTTVGTTCIAVEPLFFWPDELNELHVHSIEPAFYEKLPKLPADPAARALVDELRNTLKALFREWGAVHLQIGKSYHYADGLRIEALELVRALKQRVDPDNRINPGALGL